MLTDAGAAPVEVPRDRNGEFERKLIPKHARRLDGVQRHRFVVGVSGMATRDIQAHLADAYKVDISPELISKITDAVLPELRPWQARPLDAVVVKIRTDGRVANRPGALPWP